MATDARALAHDIERLLGGDTNIEDLENCMTRLRVTVGDPGSVDVPALKARDGVIGVVVQADSLQIVLGPGLVDRVAKEMGAPAAPSGGVDLKARSEEVHAQTRAKNDNAATRLLRRISAIFVPLIPALIACGLIAGINGILGNLVTSGAAPGLAAWTPLIGVLSAGFMGALPLFVAMNAAKEFGGTPILGGVIGAIIISAAVANVTVFGVTLATGQGGVLGALVGGILIAHVERWARSWCPDVIAIIVVPLVSVVIAGLLQVLVIMTVTGWLASVIGTGVSWLLTHGGAISGFVLGGLFLPVVMTGMHQALTPIHTALIEQQGMTILLPVLAMAGAGQIGATLALWQRFRANRTFTRAIKGALPAGFLGIGEPLIYGVTLPLGRPFITACVGGAFGGLTVGLFNQLGVTVGAVAIGVSDLSLFPLLTGSHGWPGAAAGYGAGLLAAYLAGYLATRLFGVSDTVVAEVASSFPAEADPVASDAGPVPAAR
jgi:PTS system sucrose-specific IIC component